MRQTLFYIPSEIAGVKLFGVGWLLGLWAIVSAVILVRQIRRSGFGSETTSYLPLIALVGAAIVWFMPMAETPAGFPIRGYGTMLFLAVVLSVALAAYRAGRMGIDPDIIYSLSFWLVVSGIIGARAFFVIQYWNEFRSDSLAETMTHVVNFSRGGLVVYGGVLAGAVVTVVYLKRHRLPALALCDLMAPSVALGLGLGRLGCFLNGCCYGGPADVAWAVQFPEGSPPYVNQIETGALPIDGIMLAKSGAPVIEQVVPDSPAAVAGVTIGQIIERVGNYPVKTADDARLALSGAWIDSLAGGKPLSLTLAGRSSALSWQPRVGTRHSLPVHPTQLYSATTGVLLCLFLLAIYPYRRRDGEVLAWLMILQPIGRFLLETIRVDELGQFGTSLSISQWVSLGLLAGGAALWLYLNQRPAGSVLPMTGTPDPRRLAA
ncbi:MAG: prolipoprotein diacylglyceryl transferase [Pirellulales bacterium]